MQISLSSLQFRVKQLALDKHDRHTVLYHMSRRGMTQTMYPHALRESNLFGPPGENTGNTRAGNGTAPIPRGRKEHIIEFAASVPCLKDSCARLGEAYRCTHPALGRDGKSTPLHVHVLAPEPQDGRESCPRVVEKREHRHITMRCPSLDVLCIHNRAKFGVGEGRIDRGGVEMDRSLMCPRCPAPTLVCLDRPPSGAARLGIVVAREVFAEHGTHSGFTPGPNGKPGRQIGAIPIQCILAHPTEFPVLDKSTQHTLRVPSVTQAVKNKMFRGFRRISLDAGVRKQYSAGMKSKTAIAKFCFVGALRMVCETAVEVAATLVVGFILTCAFIGGIVLSIFAKEIDK